MEIRNLLTKAMNGHDNNEAAPNAADFIGSAYLAREDLSGPVVLRIVNVRADALPDKRRRKLVARFDGQEKGLILNATNIKRLTEMFGTTDTRAWRGEVELFVDEEVHYAGKLVGGIRVRPVDESSSTPSFK